MTCSGVWRFSSPKPIFVEFAGTPKSGKSSCIDTVAHFFRREGFSVLAPTEGASKRTPPFLKKDLLFYNAWAASYALAQMLEARYHSDSYHLTLLDRGIFDAMVWFELVASGQIETTGARIGPEDLEKISNFLMLAPWRELIDVVVFFKVDPATSMARENEGALIRKEGRAMNEPTLAALNETYDRVWQNHENDIEGMLLIDTSPAEVTGKPHKSRQQAAAEVVSYILGLMEPTGRA